MQALYAGSTPRAVGVVADNHIDGHAIAVGVVDGHGCVLQPDVAVNQRHHRLALDLGVAVGHGDRRLFVTARQELGHLVVAIINERLVQRFVSGAWIGGQIFDVERLDHIHHVIGAGMLDHTRGFDRASAGFARQRHLRGFGGRAIGAAIRCVLAAAWGAACWALASSGFATNAAAPAAAPFRKPRRSTEGFLDFDIEPILLALFTLRRGEPIRAFHTLSLLFQIEGCVKVSGARTGPPSELDGPLYGRVAWAGHNVAGSPS